jgi:hypothetical protein
VPAVHGWAGGARGAARADRTVADVLAALVLGVCGGIGLTLLASGLFGLFG